VAVLVLDKRKKPLMPCSEKRARLLLDRGRARVHRMIPFTIRLVDRLQDDSALQLVQIKIDPGSKTTGLALVRKSETVDETTGEALCKAAVLILLDLHHRGNLIRNNLLKRQGHRMRRRWHLRYRPARFHNRTRPKGWLAPSLQHRVDTIMSWVRRLMRWSPLAGIALELVRFDAQKLADPTIAGTEYREGTLFGYEVREYLLEKWGRQCAYCGAKDVPLTIDHIHPRSRGGSDRVSNLTPACVPCNERKGNRDVAEFLASDPKRLARIEAVRKAPLRDAAAVNSTRWALWRDLVSTGLNVEVGSGGRTKWNRRRLAIHKAHCLDAVCVGRVDAVIGWQRPVLSVKASGRGRYKRTLLNRHGFPRVYFLKTKGVFGFQTGDIVRADITKGKKMGSYLGRVTISSNGMFILNTVIGERMIVNYRFCKLVQRSDGYWYSFIKKKT
jgi:5-methylcytosine-specific restriction endonuclease McrA